MDGFTMTVRGKRSAGMLAIGGAVAALLLGGCGDESTEPEATTVPPGPEISPPSKAPESPSAAPSVPVDANVACITADQVFEALTFADPDTAPSAQAKVTTGPVCETGWAFAAVSEPKQESASVVLRHVKGRWEVLTYGSAPCVEPRVGDAPPKVRTAAGC
jgi:hypothetical protein